MVLDAENIAAEIVKLSIIDGMLAHNILLLSACRCDSRIGKVYPRLWSLPSWLNKPCYSQSTTTSCVTWHQHFTDPHGFLVTDDNFALSSHRLKKSVVSILL